MNRKNTGGRVVDSWFRRYGSAIFVITFLLASLILLGAGVWFRQINLEVISNILLQLSSSMLAAGIVTLFLSFPDITKFLY